jgi:hypothetical protein
MNDSKPIPTLCVGADIHLEETALQALDKAQGHDTPERFHLTNNLLRA